MLTSKVQRITEFERRALNTVPDPLQKTLHECHQLLLTKVKWCCRPLSHSVRNMRRAAGPGAGGGKEVCPKYKAVEENPVSGQSLKIGPGKYRDSRPEAQCRAAGGWG